MIDWKRMKSDIAQGLKDGLEGVKDGAGKVGKKAGEVSAEGQRRMKVFQAKRRIQDMMEELGAVMYAAEQAAPQTITDPAARAILARIDAANAELKILEESAKAV
jgi:uncharacterized protein (DUF2164 family)